MTAFDTVTTIFGPNADFAGASTFAVVDSIIHLVDPDRPDEISREHDALIVQRLRDNMLAAGWTEIAAPDSANPPDVALQAAATTSDTIVIEYWPPYWGWYPGWGYPGYGWGWGWANVYSYTTGTVLTAMLDLRNPNMASETIPVIWVGALNGVISAPSNIEARIVEGLDQAFEQSPYLRT
ncbi:MAG: DUF4136 domain-containing protein [Candidatus Rokuibacteriota bacterium]